jgi:DNA-binding MarR family transcriptional regulator
MKLSGPHHASVRTQRSESRRLSTIQLPSSESERPSNFSHITYVTQVVAPTSDEPPLLDRQLTYRLHRVKKLSDLETAQSYAEECGIPLSEGRCIAAIGAFAPLSVNDLAYRANLTKGQASRAAQALVERGLVRKCASKSDARAVVLTLTPQGLPIYRDAIAMIARRNNEIFGCLTRAEQALFGEFLDRIASYVATSADVVGLEEE